MSIKRRKGEVITLKTEKRGQLRRIKILKIKIPTPWRSTTSVLIELDEAGRFGNRRKRLRVDVGKHVALTLPNGSRDVYIIVEAIDVESGTVTFEGRGCRLV